MIKEAKGFGATIEEAKENAIKNLNASDFDDIQIEVIAIPKKKILGLFGGSNAEVRAFIEVPDKKENRKKPKKDRPQQPKNTETKKPEPVQDKKESVATEEYSNAVDADTLDPESNTAFAVNYVKAALKGFGIENVSIKAVNRENGSHLILDGDGLNVIIGRKGETLDALQYLATLSANNGGGHYKISIDACNYRAKRAEALVALANRMAAQALKAGKCRTLEPMSPYERRIIHTAVQEIDGVESASFGEGSARRVVIAPTGVELKPRMSNGRNHRNGSRNRRPQSSNTVSDTPTREPMKDSDTPLYGKIN